MRQTIATYRNYINAISQLSLWNNAYRKGSPLVTDEVYDTLYEKVQQYEAAHPEEIDPSSPTQLCGDTAIPGAGKIAHSQMFSMSKIKTKEEVRVFFDRCRAVTGIKEPCICMEDKIDGLSMSLVYIDGEFQSASLRGEDGLVGDDVTEQARYIKGIPMSLSDALKERAYGRIEVRGEAFVRKSTFKAYNEHIDAAHRLTDARSMAVGTVRSQDPSLCEERGVEFCAYYLIGNETLRANVTSQVNVLGSLYQLGFFVPTVKSAYGVKGIMERLDKFREKQKDSDIPTDGVVLKLNNITMWSKMGSAGKYPRWGAAYKFSTDTATTHLTDIEWNVSPQGKLCPKALFESVTLYGRNNDRATLHSTQWIETTFPGTYRKGDTLTTTFANMIVPKILHVEHNGTGDILSVPTICPVCGEPLTRRGADLYCTNDSCFSRLRKTDKPRVTPSAAAPSYSAASPSAVAPIREVSPSSLLAPTDLNPQVLAGMNVVVSGSYPSGKKDHIKQLVPQAGGNLRTSVNAKTSLLVCGVTGVGPAKLAQAQQLGVRCISADEFFALIKA